MKVEPTGVVDRRDMAYERRKGVKDDSKHFGLRIWGSCNVVGGRDYGAKSSFAKFAMPF